MNRMAGIMALVSVFLIALVGLACASNLSYDLNSSVLINSLCIYHDYGFLTPTGVDIKNVRQNSSSTPYVNSTATYDQTVSVATNNGPQSYSFHFNGDATATARVGYGNLGASSSASSQNYPMQYEYYNNNGYASSLTTNYGVGSSAHALAESVDTITIESSTLPQYSPVSVKFTITLEGSLGGGTLNGAGWGVSGGIRDPFNAWGGYDAGPFANLWADVADSGGSFRITKTNTGVQYVGISWPIDFVLTAGSYVYAGWGYDYDSIGRHIPWHVEDSSCFANAWDTASFNLDVLTPGAYAVTESGTDYSTVPLPPTILLLASGLAGLATFRRRSKK
jgi:hypothetical protein